MGDLVGATFTPEFSWTSFLRRLALAGNSSAIILRCRPELLLFARVDHFPKPLGPADSPLSGNLA